MTTTTTTPDEGILGKAVRSGIRTAVGVAVTSAVTYAAHWGLHIDGADLATKVMPEVFLAYNGAVRMLEHKYPQLGWLLGTPRG